MLYEFSNDLKTISPVKFSNSKMIGFNEKSLEDLMAKNLHLLFGEGNLFMPIFQQRQWQAEPDFVAVNKSGDLIIFELKVDDVFDEAALQILRYAQDFGQKTYQELNQMYKQYADEGKDLAEAHKEAFELEKEIPQDNFNKKQKLYVVGCSAAKKLIDAVEYWKESGLDIDFIPYRIYDINYKKYFEFFAKPYDVQINPGLSKAIIFDTCRSHIPDAIWDMFNKNKVSAYGDVKDTVNRFNKNDIVLYYHKNCGVVAAGKITSSQSNEIDNEKYHTVEFIVGNVKKLEELKSISPKELLEITGRKGFYYAATAKVPYLTKEEADRVISVLKDKYGTK
jgi:hypothetical protein